MFLFSRQSGGNYPLQTTLSCRLPTCKHGQGDFPKDSRSSPFQDKKHPCGENLVWTQNMHLDYQRDYLQYGRKGVDDALV